MWVGAPNRRFDGAVYGYLVDAHNVMPNPQRVDGPDNSGAGLGISLAVSAQADLLAFGGPLADPELRGLVLVAIPSQSLGWWVREPDLQPWALYGAAVAIDPQRRRVAVGWPGWMPAGGDVLDDGDTGAVALFEIADSN